LLALPLVPRHDVCPAPIAVAGDGPASVAVERANPFASLQAIKSGPGKSG